MPKMPEWQAVAKTIIEQNEGQVYFNFKEVSKIIGCGINTVPSIINSAGVLVKKVGPSKRVSAYDIASIMSAKRTSPLE